MSGVTYAQPYKLERLQYSLRLAPRPPARDPAGTPLLVHVQIEHVERWCRAYPPGPVPVHNKKGIRGANSERYGPGGRSSSQQAWSLVSSVSAWGIC
jgi:hypothetical protein